MGKESQYKLIRKQLRTVVKEMLEPVLKSEVVKAIHDDVANKMNARVNDLAKVLKDTLDRIDERSKDVLHYAVKQSAVPTPPTVTEEKTDAKTETTENPSA